MQLGLSDFDRARGEGPAVPLVNGFLEKSPVEKDGFVIQSRPGLEEEGTDLGTASVDALFQKDGVLGGSQFAVADATLYEDGVSVGAIDGTGPFFIDGYEDTLFVAGGASLWGYDGATLAAIAFPDSAEVTKVVVGASRAICLRADTETYYWSDPLADDIDALDFTSAESQPDRLKDVLFIDDGLVLMGAETVEFHVNTGDSELPFQPLEGRVLSKGVKATGAAVQLGETFAWVTSDNRVCLGDLENVLSDEALEEEIVASTACRLWTFPIDATEFLALRLDSATYVMSSRTRTWSRFESYGQTNWIPACFAGGVFGSAIDGRLLQFSDGHLDLGGAMERRFRGGLPLDSSGVFIDNIVLRTNPGNTTYLSGTYAEPTIEMRLSPDGGRTWKDWRQVSLGTQGQYRKKVQWVGCGMAAQPGLLCEWRVTDPVTSRISAALFNEPFGGL